MSDQTPQDGADEVWRRDEIDSPCVKICVIDPGARICVGCHRTADEIARWSRLSAEERAGIKESLPGRAPLLRANRPSRRRNARRGRAQGDGADGDADGGGAANE